MNTKRTTLVPAGLLCLVTALAAAFAPRLAQAAGVLLIANAQTNAISKYDATTGATLQTPFITSAPGNGSYSLALDGNNHLFVNPQLANTVREYNATTGAVINNSFINGLSVPFRGPMALDANNHLFVECGGNPGSWVAEYDAVTGATINPNFINLNQGVEVGGAMAIDKANNHMFVVDHNTIREFDATTGATLNFYFGGADTPIGMVADGFNHLFVTSGMGYENSGVIEYNSLTGAVINSHFITGIQYASGVALDDNNHLFVTYSDFDTSFEAVGEYNATTGAAIKVDFISGQGLDQPASIVFVNSVPEPSSLLLLAVAVVCGGMCRRKRFAVAMHAALLVAMAAAFAPRAAQAGVLLVANLQSNVIGEYDASTGATIKANFITTPDFSVHYLALDGNNHLFVSNGNLNTVSEYNATTGATISSAFINGQGLSTPFGLALDGNNHFFVGNAGAGTVGEYNAATGATINSTFVTENQGLSEADVLALDRLNNRLYVADRVNNNIAQFDATTGATTKFHFLHVDTPDMALDGLNHLFVSGDDTMVSEYDATTGAAINNSNFVTGLHYAIGLALDGNNNLFVTNDVDNTVGKYNATTGATINPSFIQGLNEPGFLVFNSSVPEPSTFALASISSLSLLTYVRQRRRL